MTEAELFLRTGTLEPDRARCLRPVTLPPFKIDVGPYHKVQYVIELVGKQLIPSASAMQLISPRAKASMGEPEVYVMIPGQQRWRALWQGEDALTFDSLAFAWDLVSTRGHITRESAGELLRRAEEIAMPLNRRAIPLRTPEETEAAAKNLVEVKNNLDIGMDAALEPSVDIFQTENVLKTAYALGYRIRDNGLLEWRQQGWEEALLTLYPLGSANDFDMNRTPAVSGIGIGFSVPCSPSPAEVLERLFESLSNLQSALGGTAHDDEGDSLDEKRRAELRQVMQHALDAFSRIGLAPGSPEALRLFEP